MPEQQELIIVIEKDDDGLFLRLPEGVWTAGADIDVVIEELDGSDLLIRPVQERERFEHA